VLGGRPGQSFARRLVIPVSKDTLLRVVRRRAVEPISTPKVVGIDDWAWKRGHRYGTIICDLEQRRIVDILPDREAATVANWLAAHPSITIIARDRGAGFVQAATQGRPEAVQVADRWHLMENASAAFLGAIKQSMRLIRKAFGTGIVDPALLTSAETRQYDGWVRREDENAVVLALAKDGVSIKEIVRRTGKSRGIVRQIVRGGRTDVFRSRMNSLDPFTKQLETEWQGGCRTGAELWRRLKTAGFRGGLRVVAEWATRRRRDADVSSTAGGPQKTPSARSVARLMTTERSRPSKEGARVMAIIEGAVPDLVAARDLTMSPRGIIASIIKTMPTMRGPPHTIKTSTSNPETMSRTPLRRSHQAMFAPSSGSGRPKLCVAALGLKRYITPTAMMASATSSATRMRTSAYTAPC